MYVRKNATSLSEQEKEAFVEGLLALKRAVRRVRPLAPRGNDTERVAVRA